MKYKCIVSYDGVDYNGYQKKKHDKNFAFARFCSKIKKYKRFFT